MNLHFEELTGSGGARIGIASLDAPKSLNALSLPMILALDERMEAWAKDPQIVCVLLRGNGPKAFCAGGEVRSLAQACREQPGEVPALAAQFFAAEYRLDYRLHTYPKPLICWGHGYVLGGGMGLLQSAAVRIVTPSSRLAMPEISIGLYPDVGASWFLSACRVSSACSWASPAPISTVATRWTWAWQTVFCVMTSKTNCSMACCS